MQTWLEDFSLHLQYLAQKEEYFLPTERVSWSSPSCWDATEPTAPSNIQLHTGMWIFTSLQCSWGGMMNSSSSDSSLLPPEKTPAAEGKHRAGRVPLRNKWSPVPREKLVFHSLLDQTILTSLTASHKVLLGPVSQQGDLFSALLHREGKTPAEDSSGGKSSFCFWTGSFLRTPSQRHSAWQLVGKTKGRSPSSMGSSRKLPHIHTLKFWQRRNPHPLQAQQERQENTLIYLYRFLVSSVSCGHSILLEGTQIRSSWTSPPPAVRSQIPFLVWLMLKAKNLPGTREFNYTPHTWCIYSSVMWSQVTLSWVTTVFLPINLMYRV